MARRRGGMTNSCRNDSRGYVLKKEEEGEREDGFNLGKLVTYNVGVQGRLKI
jgi:hypothetical protein